MIQFVNEPRRVATVVETPELTIQVVRRRFGVYQIVQKVYDPVSRRRFVDRIELSAEDILAIASAVFNEETVDSPESPNNFTVGGPMVLVDDFSVKLTAAYDEGSNHTNGTPLNDLSHSNVWYQIGAAAPVKSADIPASSPQGGGHVVTDVVFPALLGELTTGTFWATETDVDGHESPKSNLATFTVDRRVPEAPLNFTIG